MFEQSLSVALCQTFYSDEQKLCLAASSVQGLHKTKEALKEKLQNGVKKNREIRLQQAKQQISGPEKSKSALPYMSSFF